jgi:hypothetical protein
MMAEGRGRSLWQHTSSVLCLLANIHRDPRKGRPFTPQQFNPFHQQRRKHREIPLSRLVDDIMAPIEGK